jgi:hypothetical protein
VAYIGLPGARLAKSAKTRQLAGTYHVLAHAFGGASRNFTLTVAPTPTEVPTISPTRAHTETRVVTDAKDDPTTLIKNIANVESGIRITQAALNGTNCAGTFTGGYTVGSDDFPLSGIILSTGIYDSLQPGLLLFLEDVNLSDGNMYSVDRGEPGDVDLEEIFPGGGSFEACAIEFQFSCPGQESGIPFSFDYVFGSDEYTEFVDTFYNDDFAFILNGENIALIIDEDSGNEIAVSINNVNHLKNSALFNNNDAHSTLTRWTLMALFLGCPRQIPHS